MALLDNLLRQLTVLARTQIRRHCKANGIKYRRRYIGYAVCRDTNLSETLIKTTYDYMPNNVAQQVVTPCDIMLDSSA